MKNIKFLDLEKQRIKIENNLNERLTKVLNEARYIMGPEVLELEEKLENFSMVKHASTCASGTDALILAMLALNVGPGDLVFCPSFTFPATAEAIAITGANPIFVDVGKTTFNICYKDLEKKIEFSIQQGAKPKAIIAVDLYGLPANYDRLMQIGTKYNLKVISDAAQSFGGIYNQKKVGSLADVTCTSFFPAKPLGCYGDGGAVLTNCELVKKKVDSLRSHGKGKAKYEIVDIGLNSRLDTVQAAILLSKFEVFETETASRNRIAEVYSSQISDFYKKPVIPKNSSSAWAQYTLRSSNRDNIIDFLKEFNIPTMIYYPVPMHKQPAYQKYLLKNSKFPNSEQLSSEVFSIPVHAYLSELEIEFIIEKLNKASELI